MAGLQQADYLRLLRGFREAGYRLVAAPVRWKNPIVVQWGDGQNSRSVRLWAWNITHGGGPRADDEFRVQQSQIPDELDEDGIEDVVVGYDTTDDVVIAIDRQYIEHWVGERPRSPSVQVRRGDISETWTRGSHRITKRSSIAPGGETAFIALVPSLLPTLLENFNAFLGGTMPLPTTTPGAAAPSTFSAFAAARGFRFPRNVVARYVSALAAKPFVILAGVSGTGKTKLAQLVAEYYASGGGASGPAADEEAPEESEVVVFERVGGTSNDRQRAFISVRPDWVDNKGLLGFHNPITDQYQPTDLLKLLLRASAEEAAARTEGRTAAPHFVILDEMNLARVEHYFSDFLSCLESRKRGPAGIEQEPLVLHNAPGDVRIELDGTAVVVPARLHIPVNVVITGTVNVDETTHGFSPKVLDRGSVIEFHDVNLDSLLGAVDDEGATGIAEPPTSFTVRGLPTPEDYAQVSALLHERLKRINEALLPAQFHLGYRSALEAAAFARLYSELLGEMSDEDWQRAVIDAVVVQKVLPRLHGNRVRLEAALKALRAFLDAGADVGAPTSGACPMSVGRLDEMLASISTFGFTSFFR